MRRSLMLSLVFFSILALQLLSLPLPVGAAETCVKENVPDAGFEARADAATLSLDGLYGNDARLYDSAKDAPARYAAAAFYFSQPQGADEGDELVALQLAKDRQASDLIPRDALYLAWSYAAGSLNSSNNASAAALLSLFSTQSAPAAEMESDATLRAAAKYLRAKAAGQPTATLENELVTILKANGKDGWSSEADPGALADVVVALSALYDQGGINVRTLSEMNLDIIFSRFAALNAAGAWGGVRAGDTLEDGAFNPRASPWFGWSNLLLATTGGDYQFTEPAPLLAGYHTPAAAAAILAMRDAEGNDIEGTETFKGRTGRSFVFASEDYILSGSEDTQAGGFTAPEGFVTRASVRFNDDPYSALILTTHTSNLSNASSSDAVADDGGRVFATKNLIIGNLSGTACSEPHLFIGSGFDISSDATGAVLIYHRSSHTYWMFRFLGGQSVNPVGDRYAPLAGRLPELDDGDYGLVIFPTDPTKGGAFVLERVSPSFEPIVAGETITDIAEAAEGNTTFGLTATKALNYTSKIYGSKKTYIYTPGVALTIDGSVVQPTGSLRALNSPGYQYLRSEDGVWKAQGVSGNVAKQVVLDFNTGTKTASQDVYDCPGTTLPPDEEGPAEPQTRDERLAYLAASLLNGVDSYVMECGPASEAIPNAQALSSAVVGACVLERSGERIVGIVYGTGTGEGVAPVIDNIKAYYPFTEGETAPSSGICSDVVNAGGLGFERCGSASGVSIYASPVAHVVVFSEDADPFTDGAFDGVADFFRGLFGATGSDGTPTDDAFSRGYFSAVGEKTVSARVVGDRASIRFDSLATSARPLAAALGSNAQYAAGGTVQEITTSGISAAKWRTLTASLRLDEAGTPMTFTATCGNGVIEFGEECDPSAGANGVVRQCPEGDGKVRCVAAGQANACKLDESECAPTCIDADDDGFSTPVGTATCEDVEDIECDQDPAEARVFREVSAGVYERVDCTAFGPESAQCGTAPYSRCPQCRHPGAPEVCDGVDTDCDGTEETEEGCPGTVSDPVRPTVCADWSACPLVCDVAPVCSEPCGDDGSCNDACGVGACADYPDPDCGTACGERSPCDDDLDCDDPSTPYCSPVGCCRSFPTCFPPGTPVTLADGSVKPIEAIAAGDVLLGYDEETGEAAPTAVEAPLVHDFAGELVIVNGRLEATPEHPFFTQRGWVHAAGLAVGDTLVRSDGSEEAVASLGRRAYSGKVYNMHNAPLENYYAGDVLVHNRKWCDRSVDPTCTRYPEYQMVT